MLSVHLWVMRVWAHLSAFICFSKSHFNGLWRALKVVAFLHKVHTSKSRWYTLLSPAPVHPLLSHFAVLEERIRHTLCHHLSSQCLHPNTPPTWDFMSRQRPPFIVSYTTSWFTVCSVPQLKHFKSFFLSSICCCSCLPPCYFLIPFFFLCCMEQMHKLAVCHLLQNLGCIHKSFITLL